MGGAEPNENAAKNWLSCLTRPWLLLIDNADDPDMEVTRYFPGGERGVILMTTRNPSNNFKYMVPSDHDSTTSRNLKQTRPGIFY